MITAIREIRRAKGLTLEAVAKLCDPPTTAQTIGRLETGTRTVSVKWLNRIADALNVTAADLVQLADRPDIPVAAILDTGGVSAPTRETALAPPLPVDGMVAVTVAVGTGRYHAGDEIWCRRLAPSAFTEALNRDVLIPRPAGRYLFGRLIAHDNARMQILPPGPGQRQTIVADPPWLAVATRLIRGL